ncbi:acyltransferase family protein [Salinicola tamaricis]|uniref:acyltransferase family protein n=1 Tax=Salinicola tamaricis TaxID=1771309 RepID=UPI001A936290|nr:acyltransferase [Salinicola tamaricis]
MLVSVQALRALAAWIVVFHHFMQVFFGFQADNWVEYLLSTRGQVGVDIFFVISGFVITVSTRGKRLSMPQFLLQRCAIVPAYWLYTAITALVIVFTSDVMPEYGFSVIGLIKSLLFIPPRTRPATATTRSCRWAGRSTSRCCSTWCSPPRCCWRGHGGYGGW